MFENFFKSVGSVVKDVVTGLTPAATAAGSGWINTNLNPELDAARKLAEQQAEELRKQNSEIGGSIVPKWAIYTGAGVAVVVLVAILIQGRK